MSLALDDPEEFKKNPLYQDHEYGDFTAFYATITVCTIFGFIIFLLNIFFCWCSEHRDYWLDSNTGNRWVLPLWTKTPHQQPPLDLTELEEVARKIEFYHPPSERDYLELEERRKQESDL